MHRYLLIASVSLYLGSGALAQEAEEQSVTINASGEAYLRAIRVRGVDADVVYFDPTAPAPALETDQEPEPDPGDLTTSVDFGSSRTLVGILAAAVLATALFVAIRFGSGFTVSMGRDPGNLSRRGKPARGFAVADDVPSDLATILKMTDRREALVALAQSALARAVTAHGILLQKSWTARDALRRLPRDQTHREALAALVAAGERVSFGGRDVTDEVFNEHVAKIRPLFVEAAQ